MSPVLRRITALAVLILEIAVVCPAATAQDTGSLVKAFESSLSGSPAAQEEAAVRLLKNYQSYKTMIKENKVSTATARLLDDHLVRMTQSTWGEVAKRNPGLSYVVPVGSLADRSNPKYKVGISDKDFIPRGAGAEEAAQDFKKAFEKTWGIKPEMVDVNALDPTKIETWPDRVKATANVEKYNTNGGVAWLETDMYNHKPNLWQFHPETGGLKEVPYSQLVGKAPPPLTSADALGFYSDNMKFRDKAVRDMEKIAEDATWTYEKKASSLAVAQSKYDLRNIRAFQLSGGKLTQSEIELIGAANMFRTGKQNGAINFMMKISGVTDEKAALEAYLANMDRLTNRMTEKIVSTHVSLMQKQGGADLMNEMCAALQNMPKEYRGEIQKQVTGKLGEYRWKEVDSMSLAFKQRLAGYESLDAMSRARYGKQFSALGDAEKIMLQEGLEATESFGAKAAKAAGITIAAGFAVYAVVDAYQTNEKAGGSGIAAAAGRASIELIQLGYPPALVAELVGRLGAGAVDLGISAYKDNALEGLYKEYKKDPSKLNELLNTEGVKRYNAGALRQLAIEMREKNPLITDEKIDQEIRGYFTRRATLEQQGAEFVAFTNHAESWINAHEIPLVPGGNWMYAKTDNAELLKKDEKQYYRLLGAFMQHYQTIKRRLQLEKVTFTENEIWYELFLIYRPTATDPSEFAGLWNQGVFVIVDLPFLETMLAQGQPQTSAAKNSDELAEGCSLSPEQLQEASKTLNSLKGKNLQMKLEMQCNKDPTAGTGSLSITPPKDMKQASSANEPVLFKWWFQTPTTLTCEGTGSNGGILMHATVRADALQLQLSGTWQAFASEDPTKKVLMSGTWKAVKARKLVPNPKSSTGTPPRVPPATAKPVKPKSIK